MTPQQYAAMQSGDCAVIRTTVLPNADRAMNNGGDAGDHVQVKIAGGDTVYAPLSQIIGIRRRVKAVRRDDFVMAQLCGSFGRIAA